MISIQQLLDQWHSEDWGTHISQDGLLSRGITRQALDIAVELGWLGRFVSGISSADHGVTYYHITEKGMGRTPSGTKNAPRPTPESTIEAMNAGGIIAVHHIDGNSQNSDLGNAKLVSIRENRRGNES